MTLLALGEEKMKHEIRNILAEQYSLTLVVCILLHQESISIWGFRVFFKMNWPSFSDVNGMSVLAASLM